MTYEDKMKQRIARVAASITDEKLKIWMNLLKYKTSDITQDQDTFFHVNADRMSMEDYVNKRVEKYAPDAIEMKTIKDGLYDPKYGKTKEGKMRLLGEIPADIWFTHPWFKPTLPREERDRNIKRFFNLFPAFRAGDKKL